jgi:hypothetical protein
MARSCSVYARAALEAPAWSRASVSCTCERLIVVAADGASPANALGRPAS